MKNEVLLELAARWENDAIEPNTQDGSEDAKMPNAVQKGIREGKRECADGLRSIIDLIG